MTEDLRLHDYDKYIVAFSGGKDSLACLLWLFDHGIDRSKIELWHHSIDGMEDNNFMDWPITESYCEAVAKHFDLPIYFSWKEGGFKREMLRNETPTAPTTFQQPVIGDNMVECGLVECKTVGGKGPNGTRQKFPQVSANLSVRWCSAYLKIDVCAAAIRNQKRFDNSKTLLLTGERAEESAARAKYNVFEPDRSDNRDGRKNRLVDHLRPVHHWTEGQVWNIINQYGIIPHPAYVLGWGRLSCMKCIFGSDSQWASCMIVDEMGTKELMYYEELFGLTIHRSKSIAERIESAESYEMSTAVIKQAMSKKYKFPIWIDPLKWKLPAGAFGESNGPT